MIFPTDPVSTPSTKSDPVVCALCDGHGDICNPGNADPTRAITDWLPPVGCPRCGQTGKDPNPGEAVCPSCFGDGVVIDRSDGGGATDGEFTYERPCLDCTGGIL